MKLYDNEIADGNRVRDDAKNSSEFAGNGTTKVVEKTDKKQRLKEEKTKKKNLIEIPEASTTVIGDNQPERSLIGVNGVNSLAIDLTSSAKSQVRSGKAD